MKIGNVKTDNNIFLAPMAGVTDSVFRLLCKEQSCGLVYSEMVSANGIKYKNENTSKLIQINPKERPAAIQIFGSEPDVMADMVKEIDSYADIIDINMGCPAPKIVKNNEGSALMRNPELIGKIVKKVSLSTDKPVTIKIRKGFDDSLINAVEVAQIAEFNGAKAITVHGRTREQYYSGNADWDIIKKVKENVKIPVIGNGDITEPQKAKKMFEYTNCDAVMIGRAAQGNPWIFKRTLHYINTGELLEEPSLQEKVNTALKHLYMLTEYKGEYTGIREMRKHLGWYIKGIENSAQMRVLINKAETKEEIKDILYSKILK